MVVKEVHLSHRNHKESATQRVRLGRVRRERLGLASTPSESQHARAFPEAEAPSPPRPSFRDAP